MDTLGHLLALRVSPANEDDREEVKKLSEEIQRATGENVELAYVDQGYTGERASGFAAEHGIRLEVVKHEEAKRGFVLLPRRCGGTPFRMGIALSAVGEGLREAARDGGGVALCRIRPAGSRHPQPRFVTRSRVHGFCAVLPARWGLHRQYSHLYRPGFGDHCDNLPGNLQPTGSFARRTEAGSDKQPGEGGGVAIASLIVPKTALSACLTLASVLVVGELIVCAMFRFRDAGHIIVGSRSDPVSEPGNLLRRFYSSAPAYCSSGSLRVPSSPKRQYSRMILIYMWRWASSWWHSPLSRSCWSGAWRFSARRSPSLEGLLATNGSPSAIKALALVTFSSIGFSC